MTDAAVFGGGAFIEKYLNDANTQIVQLYNESISLTTVQDMFNSDTKASYAPSAGRKFLALWCNVQSSSTAIALANGGGTSLMWTGGDGKDHAGFPIFMTIDAGETMDITLGVNSGVSVSMLGVETTV